jgi:hypothetical protein
MMLTKVFFVIGGVTSYTLLQDCNGTQSLNERYLLYTVVSFQALSGKRSPRHR